MAMQPNVKHLDMNWYENIWEFENWKNNFCVSFKYLLLNMISINS